MEDFLLSLAILSRNDADTNKVMAALSRISPVLGTRQSSAEVHRQRNLLRCVCDVWML